MGEVDDRYAWWRALRTSGLTPTARHVALVISTYMSKDAEGAYPSMSTIAQDAGRSRASVKRAVRELRDAGYVRVVGGGGRRADGGYVSNRYLATAPSGVADDPAPVDNEPPTEPDAPLGGSSGEGGGSSGEGGGSWVNGSGVTHDPRTSQELPIQQPKHFPMAPKRGKDVEKVGKVKVKPLQVREGQGREYAGLVAAGKLREDQVVEVIESLHERERRAFIDGYRSAGGAA